ncbi:MAG: hypothetical protein WBX38_11690, partial [Candidatus Sulfotelmatobacter sp.]
MFALMGLVSHILQEPESPRQLVVYLGKTPLGREIGWLWRKFWDWGSLAWVVFGVLFPVGSGVAAVEGMYLVARCFVSVGCILLVVKVIDYALTEEKPKKTKNEVAWASAITVVCGALAAWGCFSFIDVIEWNHEIAVKMTFKTSPMLTERRQHRIQWEINDYFLYLKKVGFDLPAEIPPLGLNPPNSIIVTVGPTTGPISTHSIFIPEDVIGNTDNIRFAYSDYTFNRLLTWPDMLRPGMTKAEKEHDEVAAWIMECYFPASFVGHLVCDSGSPGYRWQVALWEVRNQLGQDYADGLMCYTVNLWGNVPSKYVGEFDKFFRYKLA